MAGVLYPSFTVQCTHQFYHCDAPLGPTVRVVAVHNAQNQLIFIICFFHMLHPLELKFDAATKRRLHPQSLVDETGKPRSCDAVLQFAISTRITTNLSIALIIGILSVLFLATFFMEFPSNSNVLDFPLRYRDVTFVCSITDCAGFTM
jgi:hypothetical protein